MKKNVFGLRGVAIFAALVLLVAGLSVPAFADYWVTYSGTGARGPIRVGQDVDWSTGDTKIVSEEVIGWYNENSGVFTVTEVTATGAELNEIDGLGLGTVTTGLTAHADGLQANATALSTGFNNVMTVAGAGDSVLLPAAAAGNVVWVKNSGANAIAVFPYTSDSIDALAVNLAVTVDPGSVARFVAKDAIVWESNVDDSITLNAPTTAKGGVRIKATDNTADYTVTLTNAAHGQSSTVTIPDSGLATSYVLQSTAAITPAEANVLDGATAGTAVASKALVVDASKDLTGVRNETFTGDVTVSSDPTGGNAGARSQIIGLPRIKSVGLSTMVNGTTETVAYIDATPTGEWAEVDAGTNVAITADTTYYRDVTNSVKVAFGATAVAGDGVDGTITQDDLNANESIGFWAYTDATTAVASGDFALTIDDTDGTDQTYVLPALTSGVWTWVELNISGCDANCDTADGIKVLLTAQGAAKYGVSTGEAINLYLDAMYKWDADNEEALGVSIVQDGVLGVLTLVDANTGTHGQTSLTEYTDFFTHYETGSDFIVTVSDQSTKSGTALIAY